MDHTERDLKSQHEVWLAQQQQLKANLTMERIDLEEKKQQFENRQEHASQQAQAAREVINLNVGGTTFSTTKSTLLAEPETFFWHLLHSGCWSPDYGDSFFVDRNPKFFEPILDYLREKRLYISVDKLSEDDRVRFLADVQFYQITTLSNSLNLPSTAFLAPGVLVTVAGSGQRGYGGDNCEATTALLNYPCGIAVHQNCLYIADRSNRCVRAVNMTTGLIRTIAGSGEQGSDGDGQLATTARLHRPIRVTVYNNTLYITDRTAAVIRAVDLNTGVINTVVGSRSIGYSGDGGAANAAQLKSPAGVAIAHGTMYIADMDNHVIRAVTISTGIITTIAGIGGQAGYSGDGGLATAAKLSSPCDLVVHEQRLYISDRGNHCIRVIDMLSGIIITLAGTSNGGGGQALSCPYGLVIHENSLYVASFFADCVQKVNLANGEVTTFCGVANTNKDSKQRQSTPNSETSSQLNGPVGITVANNQLFISDNGNHRVRVVGFVE
eukprot:TRINITY_DN40222_c0_g1_i2.p1 TRINITY_DN40222_c0_g1~~TRINITY_DN40222_c0_g1_i2.p1  ORF type:complete len:550 (-),score=25.53 TRINITY_DN40222_c0_g1_i2:143-1630(-)